MRRYTLLFLLACCCLCAQAQLSRRALERMAAEAVKQYDITGRMPADSLTDKMAEAADMGLDMILKMPDADDPRQQRGCLALVRHIVAYAQTAAGRRYVDVVRNGLKKAIDRNDDADTQVALTESLVPIAKPADVPHLSMYLGVPHTAPVAYAALVAMPGIDDQLRQLAQASTPPDTQIERVLKARAGQAVSAPAAVRAKPKATPFWTVSLDRAVDQLRALEAPRADSIATQHTPAEALPLLLADAHRRSGADRDAVLARYVLLLGRHECTPDERYLWLRAANELEPSADLRRQLIVLMGQTHTLQALAYIRQYYDKQPWADASAVATHDIIAHAPQLNGGRYVLNMLNAAKRAYIGHYDEEGADHAIDDVLAAIDQCHTAGGYDLAYAAPTTMGKRGYWNRYDALTDFDMAFDYQAAGTLTLVLHAAPLLVIDNARQQARLHGDSHWHAIGTAAPWRTAHIHVRGGRVSISVNGHDICTDAPLPAASGQAVETNSTLAFNADEQGATVRQLCIRKAQ